MMKTHFIPEPTAYNGDALVNHWIYKRCGILGDAVASFVGPAELTQDQMVDLEDVLNDDTIYSANMLHFIVEIFGISLQEGVLVQRLFSSIIQNKILDWMPEDTPSCFIKRYGDDLFYQGTKKLSVSICTKSPTSILIHTGLNVDAKGAPVEAAGLTSHLNMTQEQIEAFAQTCMKTLSEEWEDIRLSCCKVRAVV